MTCAVGFAAERNAAEKTPALAAAPASSALPAVAGADDKIPSGQYKIGVVNRKAVLEGYKKAKEDYDKLQAEVTALQADLDKEFDQIQKEDEGFNKVKASLAQEEKAEREAAIQSKYRKHEADLKVKQGEIDSKMVLLRKRVLTDINNAVAKIGAEGGYHLIVDSSGGGGAVYSSPTIDVSPRVIELLNGAPAPAAGKP
jgi:Skp family chaperone for outer membrane proteins